MFLTLHGALAFGSISRHATATAAASRRNLITVFSTTEAAAASSASDKKEGPIKNEQAYANLKMDEIVSLCKRCGIIFPSSEIYNGFAGFFDYGPLGSGLKRNVKDAFWKTFSTKGRTWWASTAVSFTILPHGRAADTWTGSAIPWWIACFSQIEQV
jgi:hypothetical protein